MKGAELRAKIVEGGVEVELVGSPTEIGAVLREVLGTTSSSPSLGLPPADEQEPLDVTESLSPSESEPDRKEPRVGALQFFQDRKPTNNREATAVAAFYAAEKAPTADQSQTITKETLVDLFRQAQWKLPKRPDQTLVDTMSAGYLNRVDAGLYELSNTGHNLVVHTLGDRE